MKKVLRAAVALAGAVIMSGLAAVTASASAYDYTVPAGTQYVQVTSPASYGYLKEFAVGYTDGYVHQDPIPVSSKVIEITNFTGQAPDVQGWDGCTNRNVAKQHQPDELFLTDSAQSESNGLGGGDTQATGLHHNVTITITPVGSGPYFLWCHYEHGPETWVKLTFADGRTDEVYWSQPTYFLQLFVSYSGTATSVAATSADE